MARRRCEPAWLSRVVVDAIHSDQIREHGGLPGVRDENVLESALAQPQQKWHSSGPVDMPAMGAAYAFGLVKNHPYRDGNKRIGFLAMVTFLGVHGHTFDASDAEIVAEILALADRKVEEEEIADWIRQHVTKQR